MDKVHLSELRRALVPYLILEMISKSRQYPYALAKLLRAMDDRLCYEGDLSSAFCRLESRGYLTHEWDTAGPGQLRKYYSITEVGTTHLGSFKRELVEMVEAADAVLELGLVGSSDQPTKSSPARPSLDQPR